MPDQQERDNAGGGRPPVTSAQQDRPDRARDEREPTGPVGRGKRARAEAADAMIVEDWSWSMIPPPVLGVEGVEPGEQHVALVMVDPDEHEIGDGRRHRRLTAAQARDLAAALDARADVIDPQGARREAGGQAAELWGRQNPAGQDRPDMTVPAVLTRLREWTDAIGQVGLMERVEGPTISSDVATLLAVHPRAAATGDDHGPADPFGLDGRVTFASIDTARGYAQRHGIEPAGTVRVPWADLVAMLDEFLTLAAVPNPHAERYAYAPVRPDHPHRDTILTMLEVVGWMGRGDSRRTRLAVAAQRLDASDCRAAHGTRLHVGDVVQWSADGLRYVVAPTPDGEQPAGRLGQVWVRQVGAPDEQTPVRIDVADLTRVAYAGLGGDPPEPVRREPGPDDRAAFRERVQASLRDVLGDHLADDGDLLDVITSETMREVRTWTQG